MVLGITRGGVAVAAEVAKALKAPLYPLVIKKISSSWNPEFAIGAMGPDFRIVPETSDNSENRVVEVSEDQIQETRRKIQEKIQEYGIKNLGAKIKNKTVVIVDDGVATGWTLRAALSYAQGKQARKIVVAVPVADREVAGGIRKQVSRLVVLEEVDGLGAVGNFYEDFAPVSDLGVKQILKKAEEKLTKQREK